MTRVIDLNAVTPELDHAIPLDKVGEQTGKATLDAIGNALVADHARAGQPVPTGGGTTEGLLIATNVPGFNNSGEAIFTVSGLTGDAIPEQGAHFVGRFLETNAGDIHLIVNRLNSENPIEVSLAGDTVPVGYITPGAEYDFTFVGTKWQLDDRSHLRAAPWAKFGQAEPLPSEIALASLGNDSDRGDGFFFVSSVDLPQLADVISSTTGQDYEGISFWFRILGSSTPLIGATGAIFTINESPTPATVYVNNSAIIPAGFFVEGRAYVFTLTAYNRLDCNRISSLPPAPWAELGKPEPTGGGSGGSDSVIVADPNDVIPSAETEGNIYLSPIEGRAFVVERTVTKAVPATGDFTEIQPTASNNLLGYTVQSVPEGGDDIPDPSLPDNQNKYLIESYTGYAYHSIRAGAPANNHWEWSHINWPDALFGMGEASSAAAVYWAGTHRNAQTALQHFPDTPLDANTVYFAYDEHDHVVLKLNSATYDDGENAHTGHTLSALAKRTEVGDVQENVDQVNVSLGNTQLNQVAIRETVSENTTLSETAIDVGFLAHMRLDLIQEADGQTLDNTTRFTVRGRDPDNLPDFSGPGFAVRNLAKSDSLLGDSTRSQSDTSIYGLTNFGSRTIQAGFFSLPTDTVAYPVSNRVLIGALLNATTAKEIYEIEVNFESVDGDDRVRAVVYTGFTEDNFNDIGDNPDFHAGNLARSGQWRTPGVGWDKSTLDTPYQASGYVFVGIEFDKSAETGNTATSTSAVYSSPDSDGLSTLLSTRYIRNPEAGNYFQSGSSYLAMGLFNSVPADAGNLTSVDFKIAEDLTGKDKFQLYLYAYWDPAFPPRFGLVNPWQALLQLKVGQGGDNADGGTIELALRKSDKMSSPRTGVTEAEREYHRLIFEGDLPEDNAHDWGAWRLLTPLGGIQDSPVTGMTVVQAFTVTK